MLKTVNTLFIFKEVKSSTLAVMMHKIPTYIGQLLENHECVVISGFGGFVKRTESAKIASGQHKFYPPKTTYSFNKSLNQNDGVLANFIAVAESTTFEDAMAQIQLWVHQLKLDLSSGQSVYLKNIGTLIQNGALLNFEPDSNIVNADDFFGLSAFHLKPLALVDETDTEEVKEDTPVIELPNATQPSHKVWRRIAVAAIALPFVGYLAWLPVNTDLIKGQQFQASDLNPFTNKHCPEYVARKAKTSVQDIEFDTELNSVEEREHRIILRGKAIKFNDAQSATAKQVSKNKNSYQIIAGCFGNKRNALFMVDQLKSEGFEQATIFDKKGKLYRVSLAGFDNKKAAEQMKNSINSTAAHSVWLLKQ